MIGFYNYTVVLTYIGLMSSVFGMISAINERFQTAIFCLAFSGLCDMFDGKIARTKKDRTEDEKNFGIQIDSLCDVVCFGAFPVVLSYQLGMKKPVGLLILAGYAVASVIRLGFFNVMEQSGRNCDEEGNKFYRGLPITSISIVLPLAYLFSGILKKDGWFVFVLYIVMTLIGMLFITNFKLKKPGNVTLTVLVSIVALAVLKILHII